MTSQAEQNVGRSQLLELAVTNLGVIEDASLLFNSGMTVITGETGAGKTLLVTALQLLSGGRSDVRNPEFPVYQLNQFNRSN